MGAAEAGPDTRSHGPLHARAQRPPWHATGGFFRLARFFRQPAGGLLARGVGFRRRPRRPRGTRAGAPRDFPQGPFFPRCHAQRRREPAAPCRDRAQCPGAGGPARMGRAQGRHLAGIARRGRRLRRRPSAGRREIRRSRRRRGAQFRAHHRRLSRLCQHRRHLVFRLARFRRPRPARPFRPAGAEAVAGGGELSIQRQALRPRRQAASPARRPALAAAHGHLPFRWRRGGRGAAGRHPGRRRHLGAFHHPARGRRATLRAAALRPSVVHPLFLRHHRQAQVHHPPFGGHIAQARHRTRVARRARREHRALLLHHLRLDDVELARLRPFRRGAAGALRRLALSPGPRTPVRAGRGRGRHPFRRLGEIHRRRAQGRIPSTRPP